MCDIDLRGGGVWRYVIRDTHEGAAYEIGFHGEYRELNAPKRIVSTEVFEAFPDHYRA